MKYVVSDIHGDFEKYCKIFNAIDCGCAYGGKLAVYCLDNGREVYI